MTGIYKITNKINGKVYIGQSVNIEQRWKAHRNVPFNPKSRNYDSLLYRAIRKHGLQNFIFEVLEECEISELNEKEIYYIALYDSNDRNKGYNVDTGGFGVVHGKLTWPIVEEIKQRIKNSTDRWVEIADDYGLYEKTIRNINTGRTWRVDGEQYPIRSTFIREYNISNMTKHAKKKNKEMGMEDENVEVKRSVGPITFTCQRCGVEVTKGAKYCPECVHIIQRRAERPDPLKLAEMVKEFGFEATGRQFGVSGKTISKWCTSYGIPNKLKDLVAWYNIQIGIVQEIPKTRRPISEIVRPINQMDMQTGEILNKFKSATDAIRHLGRGHHCHITEVCKGKRKSAYGYLWQFA